MDKGKKSPRKKKVKDAAVQLEDSRRRKAKGPVVQLEECNRMETDNDLDKDRQCASAEDDDIDGTLLRRAEMYQDYMKQLALPSERSVLIPCNTWMGLAKSMKQLFKQPLHYLTNVEVERLDRQRTGSKDENVDLEFIIHPELALAHIWAMEEINRLTASGEYLARLWASDPMYYRHMDDTVV